MNGFTSGRRLLIAGCVLAAFLAIVSLVWWQWCWLSGDDSPGATIRNVVLVLASIVALPLAVWRSIIAHDQATAAQNQAAAAQAQLALAERDSLDARYQKGADMLSSENISTRIGGVYALKRLAVNHPKEFHIQVMELLCAFVRNPPESKLPGKPLDEDITSALETIIHRSDDAIAIEEATRPISSRASPSPDYGGKEGFRVNLTGADLHSANLHSAKLRGAILDNVNMLFVFGEYADFSGASMRGCKINKATFWDAVFDKALMNGTDMSNSDFRDSSFMKTVMGSDLSDSQLQRANFSRATLAAANLKNTDLENADLSGARFRKTTQSFQNNATGDWTIQNVFSKVTQRQLDSAMANPDDPPQIEEGTIDIETGKPIVWNHKLCGDRWLEHQKSQHSI